MAKHEIQEVLNRAKARGSVLDLSNLQKLEEKVGYLAEGLQVIHLAGTNGKGSVGKLVQTTYTYTGYKVGHFTSPEREDFRDQIQVDGENISEQDFYSEVERLIRDNDGQEPPLTWFELLTAISLRYFRTQGCDLVVLETGMGGANDATNIVRHPLLTVLTMIGLDHVGVIGDNLAEISVEKAGIMKHGVPMISIKQNPVVQGIVISKANQIGVPLSFVNKTGITNIKESILTNPTIDIKSLSERRVTGLELGLRGHYQLENALLALAIIDYLDVNTNFVTNEPTIRKAFKEVKWPGRMEILNREPLIIMDGAHNVEAVYELVESLTILRKEYYTADEEEGKAIAVMGVYRDKDYENMIKAIDPYMDQWVVVPTQSERGISSLELSQVIHDMTGEDAYAAETIEAGIQHAISNVAKKDIIIIFGTLSIQNQVRQAVKEILAIK